MGRRREARRPVESLRAHGGRANVRAGVLRKADGGMRAVAVVGSKGKVGKDAVNGNEASDGSARGVTENGCNRFEKQVCKTANEDRSQYSQRKITGKSQETRTRSTTVLSARLFFCSRSVSSTG